MAGVPGNLQALKDAGWGAYVAEYRNSMVDTYLDWKKRIEDYRMYYRGDYLVDLPSQFAQVDLPKIANFVQVAADDIARMVNENHAVIRVTAESDEEPDEKNAILKEHVLSGYWSSSGMDYEIPVLAHDLAGTGFAAIAIEEDPEGEYGVCMRRLNPKNCFPVIHNGKLLSLLNVGYYTPEAAAQILGVPALKKPRLTGRDASVEIIDFYQKDKTTRTITWSTVDSDGKRKAQPKASDVYSVTVNKIDEPMVAACWVKTADGAFRGLFDQVGPAVKAMNRILHLELDYAAEGVYSPFLEYDVENIKEKPGPQTIYRASSKDAFLERVEPAGSHPDLEWLMQFLEKQIRAGISYPGQRQGNVSQSIGSAAFVDSTMGQLATTVKSLQYEIGDMRFRAGKIAAKLDKVIGGQRKLYSPYEGVKQYNPETLWKDENYQHRVVYGSGAGLDALNKKVAVLQDVGAGITSLKTAREQFSDYIPEPGSEEAQIDFETMKMAYTERLVQGADLQTVATVMDAMNKGGLKLHETAGIVAQIEAQKAQQAQATSPAVAGQDTTATENVGVTPGMGTAAVPQAPPEPIPAEAVRPSPIMTQSFLNPA